MPILPQLDTIEIDGNSIFMVDFASQCVCFWGLLPVLGGG